MATQTRRITVMTSFIHPSACPAGWNADVSHLRFAAVPHRPCCCTPLPQMLYPIAPAAVPHRPRCCTPLPLRPSRCTPSPLPLYSIAPDAVPHLPSLPQYIHMMCTIQCGSQYYPMGTTAHERDFWHPIVALSHHYHGIVLRASFHDKPRAASLPCVRCVHQLYYTIPLSHVAPPALGYQ